MPNGMLLISLKQFTVLRTELISTSKIVSFAYSFKVDHPIWCDGGGEVGRGAEVEEMKVCGENQALLSLHQILVDNVCLLHRQTACEERDGVRDRGE